MKITDARYGQLVRPAEPADMLALCPTYHVQIPAGVIADIDPHAGTLSVKWIDYRGVQDETCELPPQHFHPATFYTGALPAQPHPWIEIRDVTRYIDHVRDYPTCLRFHTVEDANEALHAIAQAADAFNPIIESDPTSPVPGALAVRTEWPSHTRTHRLQYLRVGSVL